MYTTVIIEDDPMITRLNRRYIEQDSRFAVVQTFSAAIRRCSGCGATRST